MLAPSNPGKYTAYRWIIYRRREWSSLVRRLLKQHWLGAPTDQRSLRQWPQSHQEKKSCYVDQRGGRVPEQRVIDPM